MSTTSQIETRPLPQETKTESFTILDVPVSKWVESGIYVTYEYIVADKQFEIVSVVDTSSAENYLSVATVRNWETSIL